MTKPFLKAKWLNLAMLNYEVEQSTLADLVPAGTELDLWDGRLFVSVVGFQFLRTRVMGIPIPFHRDFDEVNLRFYVRRKAGNEWRRGVVFVRELVPRHAIAWVARLLYQEKYSATRMGHEVTLPGPQEFGRAQYRWRWQGRWHNLSLSVTGKARPITDASEEEFIAEHYWGYSAQRDGGCVEYKVEHPRWSVWRAVDCGFDCDVAVLYGERFVAPLAHPPSSAFLADGSDVIVYQGVKLRD
jgi:uncharacterized protein